MKIKMLILAALIASSGLFMSTPAMAFEAKDCKKGTMYYDWTHADELKLKQEDLTKPKGADDPSEIKTIADCNLPATSTEYDLMDKSTTIINVIVGVIGVIAVAVIVIGGIFYVTSAGDAVKTKKAQNTIIYGVVGLIIAILAFAIVNFVLNNVF